MKNRTKNIITAIIKKVGKGFSKTENLATEQSERVSVETVRKTESGSLSNSNDVNDSIVVNEAKDFSNMNQEETEIEVIEFGKCDLPPGYFDLCQTTEIIVEKVDPVEEFLEHLKKVVNLNSSAAKSAEKTE